MVKTAGHPRLIKFERKKINTETASEPFNLFFSKIDLLIMSNLNYNSSLVTSQREPSQEGRCTEIVETEFMANQEIFLGTYGYEADYTS